MGSTKEREYITAISIDAGIITLIDPDGNVAYYRQRGIQTLPKKIIKTCILKGLLAIQWDTIPELPRNWSISFEDTEIMGRALATYPAVLKMNREKRKAN